jgi:hypothetical protein|tara:strand:+ start:28 stop:1248 length:1221 start_codon:yes stop_codon:yes gene_type:complete
MRINSFQIDTSEMSNIAQSRRYTVSGDIGASFAIIALQNPSSSSTHTLYYDFNSNAFESGHNNNQNNLNVTLTSRTHKGNINFPDGGGDFVIKLIQTNSDTTNIISKSISKVSTITTLTFQAETSNTNSYETFPTATSKGVLGTSGSVSFNWAITNKKTDANGFGLLQNTSTTFEELNLTRESSIITQIENAWYFKTTNTVNGAITSATQFKVDDLTDIVVGMVITGVSPGSLTGEPFITNINTEDKTITISSAQTFADGITLTFKAYGSDNIFNAIGARFTFNAVTVTPTILTKAMRNDNDSDQTLDLVDTYGIAGGNVVTYVGVNVDNDTSNRVTEVTTPDVDGNNGVITVETAQSLAQGVVLTFIGSFAIINFSGNITINSYPNADRTINFDVDKFLSVGAAS